MTSKLDGAAASSRDIPDRPQPFGSEGVVSPTYIPPEQMRQMQMQQQQQYAAHTVPRTMAQPSFRGPGPAWDASDEHVATQHTSLPASEQDTTVLF